MSGIVKSFHRSPEFVTLSGVDDRTDLGRVAEMSARWPIEWGIRLSPDKMGTNPLYPGRGTTMGFPYAHGRWIARVEGSWARQIFEDDPYRHPDILFAIAGKYGRVFVDIDRAEREIVDNPQGILRRIGLRSPGGVEAAQRVARVVQRLGSMRAVIPASRKSFSNVTEVDWLFDRGLGPEFPSWPTDGERVATTSRSLVGYAGSIDLSDLASTFDAVSRGNSRYWIAFESEVRTDGWLDLDKCEEVCRAIYGDSIALEISRKSA